MNDLQWTAQGKPIAPTKIRPKFWTWRKICMLCLCGGELIAVIVYLKKQDGTKFIQVAASKAERHAYSTFGSDDFEFIAVSKGEWTKDLITPAHTKLLTNRALRFGVVPGQLLSTKLFLGPRADTSISTKIPTGKRLMILGVEMSGLQTVLHPGSLVDIVADLDLPEKGKVTGVVAESVTLNGIGDDIAGVGSDSRSTQTVSFFVTPDEFNFFAFLKDKGRFSVALRNPNDRTKGNKPNAMTLNQFLATAPIKGIYENDLFQIRK
jgi:Flp pilus assembly protein CpaB